MTYAEKEAANRAALRFLDRDGGWDHLLPLDHPNEKQIYAGIRLLVNLEWAETGTNHDIREWRLTDEGVEIRRTIRRR